jgi:hypothetical protein
VNQLAMKIIGVGMPKTGTTSLAVALTHLGFPCVHGWPPWSIETGAALADVNASCRYRELDVMYPGSKFVLTTRQREPWLKSCQRHWETSDLDKSPIAIRFEYYWCRANLFGRLDFDAENHWRAYERHVSGVRSYFQNRSADLLEIDLTCGGAWEPLCRFLNVTVPTIPFPWENRGR